MGLEAARQSTPEIHNPGNIGLTSEQPLLRVQGLSVRFDGAPNGVNVVDDVSFSVSKGKTLCIVGESGCGKSVTSLALIGFFPPLRHGSSPGRRSSTGGTSSRFRSASGLICAATGWP